MNEPIKVLHVVGQMNRGGTEALIMSLLRTLNQDQFHYDIVEQTDAKCAYDDEMESLGVTIYRCPHISPKNIRAYRQWWRDFFAAHPEYRIVHGHSRGSAPLYLDEAKKAGRITIAHCHSNSHGKGLSGLIRYLWQLPLRHLADYNLACSHEAGLSQYGKKGKFKVIKNGIQSERYVWNPQIREKVRKEFGLSQEPVLGNVSRFELPKNHSFLLDIFKEVKAIRPDAKLMLVGDGSLRKEIHEKAYSLGVEDSIIYTGVRSDVNELLQAMDVFVFPSVYEGLPVALIEAQAAGLPCYISEKVISPAVKITDLVHFVSLDESAQNWASEIVRGAAAPEDRRNMSAQIAEAGFDIKTTAINLNAFYLEILNHE